MAEVVAGIECTVAKKLEDTAMEIVGAGLGLDRDDSAGRKAILRVEVVRNNAKLLRGIGIGKGRCKQQVGVEVLHTVEQVVGATLAAAIGGGACLIWEGIGCL